MGKKRYAHTERTEVCIQEILTALSKVDLNDVRLLGLRITIMSLCISLNM